MNWPEDFIGKIIQGDCLEVMKQMPDKCVDLVLTDPPYGINASKGVGGFGASDTAKKYEDIWDLSRPCKLIFDEIFRISINQIIFGGNFFTDYFPVNSHWIVWDKKGGIEFNNPYGDCELAWTNYNKKSIKKYTVIQQGFISAEKKRFHPTQKPVQLIENILVDYIGQTILDPFLGSGTTAVAAERLGRRWIGIEMEPKYCAIAQARVDVERNQLKFPGMWS